VRQLRGRLHDCGGFTTWSYDDIQPGAYDVKTLEENVLTLKTWENFLKSDKNVYHVSMTAVLYGLGVQLEYAIRLH